MLNGRLWSFVVGRKGGAVAGAVSLSVRDLDRSLICVRWFFGEGVGCFVFCVGLASVCEFWRTVCERGRLRREKRERMGWVSWCLNLYSQPHTLLKQRIVLRYENLSYLTCKDG